MKPKSLRQIENKISDLRHEWGRLVASLNVLEPTDDEPEILAKIEKCLNEIDRLTRTLAVRQECRGMLKGWSVDA